MVVPFIELAQLSTILVPFIELAQLSPIAPVPGRLQTSFKLNSISAHGCPLHRIGPVKHHLGPLHRIGPVKPHRSCPRAASNWFQA